MGRDPDRDPDEIHGYDLAVQEMGGAIAEWLLKPVPPPLARDEEGHVG